MIKNMVVLCISIAISFTGSSQFTENEKDSSVVVRKIVLSKATTKPAQIDGEEILDNASKWANSFNEFSCKFVKQERLGGELNSPQTASVKARQNPALVRMDWQDGDVQASSWCEGRDYIMIDPYGWWPISLKLTDKRVLEKSINPITSFGFIKSIGRIKIIFDEAESTEAEELRGADNNLIGYVLIIKHSYTEDKATMDAQTTVVFGVDFELESIEQVDQNGIKFRYTWSDLNKNISISDDDLKL